AVRTMGNLAKKFVVCLSVLISISSTQILANELCRKIIASLDSQKAGLDSESRVELVLKGVIAHGAERRRVITHKMGSLLGQNPDNQPVRSYHHVLEKIDSTFSIHSLPRIVDTRFSLRLPEQNSPTVWEALSTEERTLLTEKLVLLFQGTSYDLKMGMDHDGKMLGPTLSRGFGISPSALFQAAVADDCFSGTCRQVNSAAVGILGELGIPKEDIRIEVGYHQREFDKRGHLWFSYRPDSFSSWIAKDATGFFLPFNIGDYETERRKHIENGMGDQSSDLENRYPLDRRSLYFLNEDEPAWHHPNAAP
ncbi:MAG: hypothetical protein JWQ35_2650, partial [Bacteriovoracaceae bacterium]|nr:hypothetical protein [Bacteriovoracaceae bacterium]